MGVWHVAFSSVRISISVSLLARARATPQSGPCGPVELGLVVVPLFPMPENVGVRSGQEEAYAKVICQDLLNYCWLTPIRDQCGQSCQPSWHSVRGRGPQRPKLVQDSLESVGTLAPFLPLTPLFSLCFLVYS